MEYWVSMEDRYGYRWDTAGQEIRKILGPRSQMLDIVPPIYIPAGCIKDKPYRPAEPMPVTIRLYYERSRSVVIKDGFALAWTKHEVLILYLHSGRWETATEMTSPLFECWLPASQVQRRDSAKPMRDYAN